MLRFFETLKAILILAFYLSVIIGIGFLLVGLGVYLDSRDRLIPLLVALPLTLGFVYGSVWLIKLAIKGIKRLFK